MQEFGNYIILDEIAQHEKAEVYYARQLSSGEEALLKIYSHDISSNENFVSQLIEEAKKISRLDHHGIPHVYAAGICDNKFYTARKYAEGNSLKNIVLSKKKFEYKESMRITKILCEILGYAHENDVIHGNIKPENVIISEKGTPVLVDFGICSSNQYISSHLRGVERGDFSFTAPWQEKKGKAGIKSDIYSIGVIAFYMITGISPRSLGSDPQNIMDAITERISVLEIDNPSTQSWVWEIVKKCMGTGTGLYMGANEIITDINSFMRGKTPSKADNSPSKDEQVGTSNIKKALENSNAFSLWVKSIFNNKKDEFVPKHLPKQEAEQTEESSSISAETIAEDTDEPLKESTLEIKAKPTNFLPPEPDELLNNELNDKVENKEPKLKDAVKPKRENEVINPSPFLERDSKKGGIKKKGKQITFKKSLPQGVKINKKVVSSKKVNLKSNKVNFLYIAAAVLFIGVLLIFAQPKKKPNSVVPENKTKTLPTYKKTDTDKKLPDEVTVKFKNIPESSTIIIDDKEFDAGQDVFSADLKPGDHSIVIKNKNYITYKEKLKVESGTSSIDVECNMKKLVNLNINFSLLKDSKQTPVLGWKPTVIVKSLGKDNSYKVCKKDWDVKLNIPEGTYMIEIKADNSELYADAKSKTRLSENEYSTKLALSNNRTVEYFINFQGQKENSAPVYNRNSSSSAGGYCQPQRSYYVPSYNNRPQGDTPQKY